MAEGFSPTPEDVQELRQRLGAREEKSAGLNDQRNVILETENPDDAAYDLKKSQELGIPREAIGGARDEYRTEDTLAKMQKLRAETPKTGAWLAEPDNFAVARDEADDLSAMERLVLTYMDLTQTGKVEKALASIGPAAEASFAGLAASTLEQPGLTPVDAAILNNLDKVRTPDVNIPDVKVPAIRNPFAKAKVRLPEMPEALDPHRIRDRASRNALAAALSANQRLDAARPKGVTPESQAILSGVGSAAEMAPAMAAGFAARNPTVPMAIMGRQVYGQSYARGRDEGLSPGGAVLYAGAQSGVERVTERIGLEFLFGRTLAGETLGKRLLASMAAEQVQEQFATLGQDFVDWKALNPEKTMAEFIEERGPAAYQTAIATFIASAPTNTAVLGAEAIMKDMARKEAMAGMTPGETLIADVLDKATASKLGARSPEKLADLLGRVTDGTSAETVVVDLDGVVDSLSQAGLDPTETLAALGVSENQLAQKWERFGEVEVSLATVAASPVMRQHRDAIQPHLRTSNEEYTPAGKERARTELETDIQTAADTIRETMEAGRALEAQTEAVAEKVRQRIRGAGILAEREQENASVAIQTAMVTTLAKRVGADPVEFFDQHYPRVQGNIDGMVSEEDALEQAKAEGYEGQDTGEAASWVRAKAKGLDMSTPARMARAAEQGFTVEAFRGMRVSPKAGEISDADMIGGGWFADSADTANTYAADVLLSPNKGAVMKARLRLQNPLVVDAGGKMFDRVPASALGALATDGKKVYTTQEVAALAEAAGHGGVEFRNIKADKLSGMGTEPGTIWYVADAANVRSEAAAFDPDMADETGLLNQLIGPKATSANKAILDTAKKMAREKVKVGKGLLAKSKLKYTRQQIWDKTAEMGQPWYQDADGQWISEIEDGVIVVKEAKGRLNEVIEFPTLYAEYPDLAKMRADARDKVTAKEDGVADVPGTKGTFSPRPLFGAHVRISDRSANSREYTVTHELQHAVDHLEGRKMGMNKKYLYRQTERRAFNTMYRRLWTMEERIATPPWKTEQEAIDWMMGMRDMNADPARFGKEGTFDPGPVLPEPETTAAKPSADQNVPQGAVNRDLAMPEEVVQRSWHLRSDGSLAPAKFKMFAPPTALLGRTFLSVRDLLRSAAKNEQIAKVIDKASVTDADVRAAVAADVRAIFEKHAQYQKERPQENEVEIWIDAVESVDTSVLANIGYSGELAEAIYENGLEAGLTERQIVERFTDQFMQSPYNFDYAATSLAGKRSIPRTRSEENRAVKEVEAALADKLLDMDKPLSEQLVRTQVIFTAMIAEEQQRPDLIAGGYVQTDPGYFDSATMNELITKLAMSRADESFIRDPMVDFIKRLRASGIVGARYTPGGIREDGPPQTQSIVIFDERAPVLLTDPSGNLMQQRRGQFSPSQNIITMFEAADVTTLMHEGAHWYLAEIERMAMAESPHPFVTEQWEAVKKWGKVGPDFRMYDDAGRVTEEGRELQEAFAETFEVYLQTGKAPVPSLREAFRAFKQWITALWRDIRTGKIRLPERANLSPEIVRVMDRMLAVDEEIESQTAEVITKAEAMANDLYDRGIITKRQRDAAIMNLDEAREAAKEDLMAQIMQAELRVREAQMSAEQRRIKGDVTREFDRSAVGRALSWLGYGQWKGDVPVSETEARDAADMEMYQSIRTATRMPMEDIHAWVVQNVDSNIQQLSGGDEGAMMSWRLSDAPDAPRVLLSIRLNRKGRADVNLFLDNKMADALDGVTDVNERKRIAMEMFSQAVMVMRQYSAETPDLKAFNFIAAENEKAGRKAKSREELYRFLLSTMRMDGYTAYEIGGQTSVVQQTDGVKSANPLFDSTGFVMIRDGVNVDEFARNEILRGSQRGGDTGEVVTALTAVQLSRPARGAMGRGRPQAGRADPRGAVDALDQSPRDLIRPASEQMIGQAPQVPSRESLVREIDTVLGFAEAILADTPSPDLANVTLRLRQVMRDAEQTPTTEWLGAWYANLEALARVGMETEGGAPITAAAEGILNSPTGRRVMAVLNDRGISIMQPEQLGEPPLLLVKERMFEGDALLQRGDPKGWGETAPPPDLPPMRLDLEAVRQLYGEDAVRRLPRAIRDRSRDKTSIDGMMDIVRASAKTLKRKPPPTLFQFIRSRKARTVAGQTVPIKKWGIKGAADELRAMNREDLINEENGIHIDYVRESAAEAGYLAEDATLNDFLNAIDREARGEPVYSRYDQKEVEDQRFAKEWADWLDSQGVDMFETDQKKLKAEIAKIVTSTAADAVTPDQAAEMLGFPTGEDLLNVLSLMGSRDQWIKEETDRRLREEFGDPMADGTFEEEARVIAEAEVMSRAAEIEMEALARAVGEPAASKLAKEMAMESLGLMTVKELEGWERFLSAERREMNNTLEAVKRGDMVQAFIHKRRQLVNMHLAKAAREKSIAIEKTRKDLLTYYSSKGRRDKIARDYLEKIEALLDGYELRVSKQGPGEQRRRLSAKEYVDQMTADGREAEIAPEALLLAEMAGDKVWRGLTADEVDYLAGTVKNLAHLGRTKDKLLRAQEKRRFQAVIGALVDRMNETGKLPGVTRERSPTRTASELTVDMLREGHSWLMRPEHQARSLDGGELGAVWEALFRPMAEAADVETQMMREATRLYREAWSKFSGSERNAMSKRTVSVPELPAIGKRFTQLDLISIALNWGVIYNREVLLEGYGWTADQVEAALFRTMTDKHWDLVESLWTISGMYKAEAFALEKAMTGVEPKAVEGISFTLPSGRKIDGKYYHIQYDANQPGKMSRRQAKDNDAEALTAHRKSRSKAMTKNGGLIERKGSGGRKVKLGLSVFEKAMSETIHDIAFRRAVFDVGRIIADDNFADTYQEVAGMEAYRQLNVWLKDIAMPPMEVLDPIVKAFAHVRRNIPLAVMGYKVGTALIQPTGLLAAMPLVGHRRVLFAVAKAFANPRGSMYAAWKQVADMSEFMRDRVAGYERDVRETTTAMTKGGGLDFIRRNAFVFITGIDIAVSVPTWMAAYGKAMDGKVKGIQAGVEEDAIAYADSIIRRTQTAGKTQDLSRFQRGGEFQKQISMIFGYFNNLYSLSAQQTLDMRRGNIGRAEWAWHMSILFVAIPLLAEVFAGRLFPDDEDDEETIEGKIAETVLLNFTGMFPGLRDAVALNVKPEFGYRLSPTSKFIEDIGRTAGLPAQLLLDEDRELTEADVRRAVNAMGGLTGLPSAQINISGNYIIDVLEGEEDPTEHPLDAAREALVRNTR